MLTLFDFVTVACFLAMAVAFFTLTARESRTLLHMLVAGVAFAVANQLGNADHAVFGSILIILGAGYAVIAIRQG